VLPIWREYGAILQELGYCSWAGILQAEAYGVPQTRKRAIFMARRDKNGVFPPAPTHSKYYSHNPTKLDEGVLPWISMAEALGWVGAEHPAPTLALSGSTSPIGGSGSRAAWEVRTRGASERPNDIFSADAPARTVTHSVDYWETRPASTIVTTRRSKDGIIVGRQLPEGEQSNPERGWTARRPSTTIVGSFSPDIVAPPTYRKAGDGPRQNQKGGVKITLQQALILQGFPPDYPVMGKKTKQFLQVGNAIPPPLALAILKALIVKK
jgi:DNA (cytosine-5)-methyltransferase 1